MMRMVREWTMEERNFLVVRRTRGVPLAHARDDGKIGISYFTITTITTIKITTNIWVTTFAETRQTPGGYAAPGEVRWARAWWQQDGATLHTSNASMEFLIGIFGRILSARCTYICHLFTVSCP